MEPFIESGHSDGLPPRPLSLDGDSKLGSRKQTDSQRDNKQQTQQDAMKKYLSRNVAALVTVLFVLLLLPGVIHAEPRLIGISGISDGPGLYEINPTNAVTTLVFTPSPVSDTPTLGFCPTNGMLYFFG